MRNLSVWMIILLLHTAIQSEAQILKKIKDRAENAVVNKLGEAVDKGVNKSVDKPLNTQEDQKNETAGHSKATQVEASLTPYSKYDFVAGNKILLEDDFYYDAIGEFPKEWNTNNKAAVVKLPGYKNNWLKLAYSSTYLSPYSKDLPENFTLEFDVIMDLKNKGYGYPIWDLHFFHAVVPPSKQYMSPAIHSNSNFKVVLQPGDANTSRIVAIHTEGASATEQFKSPLQNIKFIESLYGKPIHVAMSVQGQRFRMWINEVKVFDLPKSYPVSSKLNRFAITISPSVYTEEDLGLYFSSFKMAAGMPEANTKILTEGKWSTTAITFDVASDRVRESSMGAIKELGELLAGNQDLRLQIIGHTDNDGNKQANLELSEKRAISVKRLLKTYYGVDDERITTIGKGSTEPVGDNKTTIGKAQNRRVEFIKL